MNRRVGDERLNKMERNIEEIKKSSKRIEMAIFGDDELEHRGLICQTKINTDSIKEINEKYSNGKSFILGCAFILGIVGALIKDYLLSFFRG